ncbi:MAG: proline dehydrogenase family protein [Bacteroidales bacterium]|nr:proline dehydrogenase family protein [Bacteroidales bacterium]
MHFKNTQVAYAYKTKKELKSALFVYRIITKPFMVTLGKITLNIALFLRIPIKPFTNFMFKQFCGGENLDEVLPVSKKLGKYNVKSIPDYSVEGVSEDAVFNNLISEVKKVIDLVGINKNIPFAVFKPTGLINAKYLEQSTPNEHPEVEAYKKRIDEILSYASKKNVSVLIDAEDFMYQQKIDEILLDFMKKYNREKPIVFTTLQMYRNDRLDYLEFLIEMAKRENFKLGIKFVRGAYMEKERQRAKEGNYPDPIYSTKSETDAAYDKAIKISVENIKHIEVFNGTHNEESVMNLVNLMEQLKLKNNDKRLWFSQLYGMRDNISFNLAAKEYNVAKYVPYGPIKEVMPYLVRRAEENSSMESQAKEEIVMLKKEMKAKA